MRSMNIHPRLLPLVAHERPDLIDLDRVAGLRRHEGVPQRGELPPFSSSHCARVLRLILKVRATPLMLMRSS